MWERLRAEFVLHDEFWLVFLFGIQAPDVAELVARAAATLVELRRELVQRYPDSPTALRDLSVSLDNVAEIQQQRGQLDNKGFHGSRGS